MKLIIDKSIWLRGDPGNTYLLRKSDQKMCCIGIYLESCGVSRNDILEITDPHQVHKYRTSIPDEARWLVKDYGDGAVLNSDSANQLIHANDSSRFTEAERMREITKIFEENEVEVEFI